MFENLIDSLVTNQRLVTIKTSVDFFFQKGQDALNIWLDLDVNEQQKTLLQKLAIDYKQFSNISESQHPELLEIKLLLHKIISYCDDKARGKNNYNEYEDKRTLARAGVRMAPWIKYVVDYKFDREKVYGSIKNALDYLLDPLNNSTILSENHRAFIVSHYLSKPYQPEQFAADLKEIFKEFNIDVKNELNFTHLLSTIIYDYEEKWKPKKSIKFKELVEELIKYKNENKLIFNLLPFKINSKYLWISDDVSVIGSTIAHYEVSTRGLRGNKDIIYVDVHFESKSKLNRDVFLNAIEELPEDLEWIDWYKSKSIGYKESFKLSEVENIAEKIFNALEYIEETIGDKIREIVNTISDSSEKKINNPANSINDMENPHNQILFGPPGTGKTYNTINEAIKIADPEFYKANHDNRDELKKRFKLLLLNNDNENVGQIGFTTFHQSMSYEDFIEGIKPVQPIATDTYLKYEIQEGIFKRICRIANDSINAVVVKPDSLLSLSQDEFDKAHFYKMSLGNSQSDLDNEIYDYCIQNNCIALGWGDGYDYTGKDEKSIKEFAVEKGIERFSLTAINQFKILLKGGDYVIISNGNYYVRAIGKVIGEYEFREESPFANNPTYNQFRDVEWIFTDKSIPATEIYNKNLSQQTIYQLIKNEIKQEFFVKDKKVDLVKLPKNPKKYVLIIDEINRGNVSSIFGELITLIEKDKRAGTDEELSVVLPYSKKEFRVPQNVFIIGTMNTADRSIEALDTALRRRFSFREMPPKPELILQEGKLKAKSGRIDDIDVVEILKVMNDRIEKLIDKDHKIGHSYFLSIETLEDLKQTFKNKVIPLLEEYFFGDFGKISLVLGSSFITKSSKSGVLFAKNNEYDPSVANDLLERGVYEITSTDNWDFKAIYQ